MPAKKSKKKQEQPKVTLSGGDNIAVDKPTEPTEPTEKKAKALSIGQKVADKFGATLIAEDDDSIVLSKHGRSLCVNISDGYDGTIVRLVKRGF